MKKNYKIFHYQHVSTFASRTCPSTNQSLQKSVLFGNQKRNSFFFSHPSVFYFFATRNRHINSWTDAAVTFTHSDLTMTVDRRPACNSGLGKVAIQCSAAILITIGMVNQTLVSSINSDSYRNGKNRHLRQAPKH